MKNKVFYKLIFLLLACSLCFSYFALSAFAFDTKDKQVEFYCAEPAVDSNNGYAIFFFKSSNGNIWGRLISWYFAPCVEILTENPTIKNLPVDIRIDPSNIIFTFDAGGDLYSSVYSLLDIFSNQNSLNGYSTKSFVNEESYTISFAGNEFLGYVLNGNSYISHNTYPAKDDVYNVLFSADAVQYNQLLELLSVAQQLGLKLDEVNGNLTDVNVWLQEIFYYLSEYIMYSLWNIEDYNRQMQLLLVEARDLLIEIRDALGASGPSFEETMGEDFGNDLGDYNAGDAVGSLPNQFEGDKNKIYSGIGFFTKIFDNLLGQMPELKHALIFILTLGFVGYVIGRRLNKVG